MTLKAMLRQQPEVFDRLARHWHRVTGAEIVALDAAGEWIAGSGPYSSADSGGLPDDWHEWLAQASFDQGTAIFEQGSIRVAPVRFQDVPAGYLVAVGEAPPDLLRWSAESLVATVAAQQSLQDVSDELTRVKSQLEMVSGLTRQLGSTPDLVSVLRAMLAEIRQFFGAGEALMILEQDGDLTHISAGGEDRRWPPWRQAYGRLQTARPLALHNDPASLHEFWPEAPADLTNMLVLCLPLADSAQAVLVLANKEAGFKAEDGDLLGAASGQLAAILDAARSTQQMLRQARLQREYEIAAEIQTSLLPRGFPEIPGVEFAVAALPAPEVGGDFFDFIPLADDSLAIVLGGVEARGVPAAVMTVLVRAIVRMETSYGHSPQRVVARANQILVHDLQHAEASVTALVAYFDPNELSLTYASAGRVPGLWWRAEKATFELLQATAPALGGPASDPEGERTLQLEPGDFVILVSDGITQAKSPDQQVFGAERLGRALLSRAGGTAGDLVQSVLSELRAFRRDAPWADDLTMVVLRIKPSVALQEPRPEPVEEFALPANLHSLESISQRVTRVCRSLPDLPPAPISEDFVYLIELAVSEICTNLIEHAYQMAGGEIRGSLTPLENGIQIDLYDDGESFDPAAVPDPTLAQGSPNEGGYGLHIVRQIMDKVEYQAHTPKGNHWRLIKYLPSADPARKELKRHGDKPTDR